MGVEDWKDWRGFDVLEVKVRNQDGDDGAKREEIVFERFCKR